MNHCRLTYDEVKEIFNSNLESQIDFTFDETKQVLTYRDKHNSICELTLPLFLPTIRSGKWDEIVEQIERSSRNYTIIFIQAGAAAIGYYESNELVHHKIIKKYMVRKKQGKSQIKYLKSKGKSRLGSRIRLQNSVLFFEEISSTLGEWNVATGSETILLSVPINLINLLFTSKVPVPFKKKDRRIKKIPVDVRVPSFKELEHINWIASRGILKRQELTG